MFEYIPGRKDLKDPGGVGYPISWSKNRFLHWGGGGGADIVEGLHA